MNHHTKSDKAHHRADPPLTSATCRPKVHVRVFTKALQCLQKIGDYVTIQATPDEALCSRPLLPLAPFFHSCDPLLR